MSCRELQCVAVCCSVLQRVAACRGLLQCVAAPYLMNALVKWRRQRGGHRTFMYQITWRMCHVTTGAGACV